MMLQERMTVYCKDPKAKRETIPGRPFGHRPDQRGTVAIAAVNHGDGTARGECPRAMACPDAGSIPTPVPCGKAVNPQTSGRRGERRTDVPGATEPERSATGCRHRRVQ